MHAINRKLNIDIEWRMGRKSKLWLHHPNSLLLDLKWPSSALALLSSLMTCHLSVSFYIFIYIYTVMANNKRGNLLLSLVSYWSTGSQHMTGCSAVSVLPDCCVAWLCTPPFPCCVLAAVPEAKVWEEEFDLNSVRLCFQASFTLPTGELVQLNPVVSQPIYDNSEWKPHIHESTYEVFSKLAQILNWLLR